MEYMDNLLAGMIVGSLLFTVIKYHKRDDQLFASLMLPFVCSVVLAVWLIS